ncbi:MAG TPA: PKD domain-containing protein, partial [Gemmatimonadales bacterium]|nr:PKD domain-containing protein [Gemmatimonadales bacterium]
MRALVLLTGVIALTACSEAAGPVALIEPERPRAAVAPSGSRVLDDFNDNARDTLLWTAPADTGRVRAVEANGRLEITMAGSASGAVFGNGYASRCTLAGDFDIRVDYHLLEWPAANGVRVGLSAGQAGRGSVGIAERVSEGRNDVATGEVYLVDLGAAPYGIRQTTDLSGTLRLTRSGSTVAGYYWDGAGWVLIRAGPEWVRHPVVQIIIWAWSHDYYFGDRTAKLAFDNVVVHAGALTCPVAVVAAIAGPAEASEGDALPFDGTASSGPAGSSPLTYRWSFGDGTPEASGPKPVHTYADNGGYAVRLTVADSRGVTASAGRAIAIRNVAPAVSALPSATLLRGETYAAGGSYTDPGADSWSATVDPGDGAGAQPLPLDGQSFTLSHAYRAAGTFALRVRVQDDDLDAGTSDATVEVLTPAEATRRLLADVRALSRARMEALGGANGLEAKLEAAIRQLDS